MDYNNPNFYNTDNTEMDPWGSGAGGQQISTQIDNGQRDYNQQLYLLDQQWQQQQQQYKQNLEMEALQHVDNAKAEYEEKAREFQRKVESESHRQIMEARERESRLYDQMRELRDKEATNHQLLQQYSSSESSLRIKELELENTTLKTRIKSYQEANEKLTSEIELLQKEIKSLLKMKEELEETNDAVVGRLQELVDIYEPIKRSDSTPQQAHEQKAEEKDQQKDQQKEVVESSMDAFDDDKSFHSAETSRGLWFSPLTQLSAKPKSTQPMVLNNNASQQQGGSDNNQADNQSISRNKNHRAPAFRGITDNDETKPYLWILDFEKCIQYHGWNEQQTLDEFMMSMQGPASLWYNTLLPTDKVSYQTLISKFQNHFGGVESIKSYALRAINDKKQGTESMISYGPKLITTICSITSDPGLQMYFFGQMVNSETAAMVNMKEPNTLQEAVDYAVRMERKTKERNSMPGGGSGGGVNLVKTNQPQSGSTFDYTGAWAQKNATGGQVAPMEDVQMNAQRFKKKFYSQKNNNNEGSSSKGKSKCFACGKTGHIARECRLLKKFKKKELGDYHKEGKKKKDGRNSHNVQQVKEVDEEIDFKTNPFNQLFQHNDMMKVVNNNVVESKDPRSFTLPVKVNDDSAILTGLVDTG